ncbi:GTPase domain-containing protein [Bacillus sp. 165]|uniref:GTPase domain-containing protein n=1 Tax=Bacillus sp. 165 TaxID=1529117 RepID=UPI001ADA79EE|nr:GTPase domain-containing protein [Bacillus sp. 165]MBO9129224.1 GTPase domain-containing protein [Bacillus sp. 165]
MKEQQLVDKSYYQVFIQEDEVSHPFEVLNEIFYIEKENGTEDLSFIRFAQGEIYYHYKDYETAIFKWEKVKTDLLPWAQKNIADCYYELGMLSAAEDIYKSIATESDTLATEISLKLFSLYAIQNKEDLAFQTIGETVSLNPDYPNVTALARAFYEEQSKWDPAVELAINEIIRTESVPWIETLKRYIEEGYTAHISPSSFFQVLLTVYKVDMIHFRELTASLWNCYKQTEYYLPWVQLINDIFLNVPLDSYTPWNEIAELYEKTYMELIQNGYFLKELHPIVPNHITNWLKVTAASHSLYAATAAVAWNEIFPASVDSAVVSEAKQLIHRHNRFDLVYEDSVKLYEAIVEWSKQSNFEPSDHLQWWGEYFADFKKQRVILAGLQDSGKSSFVNSLLGEDVVDVNAMHVPSPVIILNNGTTTELNIVTETKINTNPNAEEIDQLTHTNPHAAYIECKIPCRFLNKNAITLIDTPGFPGEMDEQHVLFEAMNLADGVLFMLDATAPFTEYERETVQAIQEHTPNMPIHFLLTKIDSIHSEEKVERILRDTISKVRQYFPAAKVFPYSSKMSNVQQLSELAEFIKQHYQTVAIFENRTVKLLPWIRKVLRAVAEKPIEQETYLSETIQWNEDMQMKLNGLINSMTALEKEKIQQVKSHYLTIKEELSKDILEEVPILLRGCSTLLDEEVDYRNIHEQINKEMNRVIQNYIETAVSKFSVSVHNWITETKQDFTVIDSDSKETSSTFNSLYKEDKMKLEYDFKIFDDWRRDMDRLIGRARIENVNVFRRMSPSQLLLKGIGKLFGKLQQSNAMLHSQYKKYFDNEEFQEEASLVVDMFFSQFEPFEHSLEQDIILFFRNPFSVLRKLEEQTHLEIQKNRVQLNELKSKPERYKDPITLFEVRLHQAEWLTYIEQEHEENSSKQASHSVRE